MPIKPQNRALYPTPKIWRAIRAEVLERDGHRCAICRVENGKYIIRSKDRRTFVTDGNIKYHAETGERLGVQIIPDIPEEGPRCVRVVLTIAHMDHDPTNNGEPGNRPNLKALCQMHHLRHDHEHHKGNAARTRAAKKASGDLFDGL